MLFESVIFGPIKSRRLGISLGVNLLPATAKVCSFNCIYCECGFNFTDPKAHLPSLKELETQLEQTLERMVADNKKLDSITFAGNGEPTMHPQFAAIIDATIRLRNRYYPQTKISVLSNATMLHRPAVVAALNKVDNNILKLDSVIDATVKLINQPVNPKFDITKIIEQQRQFNGNLIVQSLFLKGTYRGQTIDNTTEKEVSAWLNAIDYIRPKLVEIYSLDRIPPISTLQKVDSAVLQQIADRVEKLGISTSVIQ
ncbi:MAG: radical SAM protein [Paludibacteraceae bacterium]|jgi:wyosine [tRNA(Phe)-imidazoG37] synthetase (radical SAM superfamily)|nr:radical SAM protein [Paludibacteraceae bacterium]MDI9536779.1 radical SAM protein [Bacteroidota bacterium]OQC34750.1 MAG: molybdenum cofactor biosynthesis protein A [Bacteroidetes bacterium ADurb.Bin057]HHT61813.1 radical SAM protein [Bacteroidales bacterium]MBP9038779.1 radical SAM protein [Paludibacteraceae bacterium]